jgi:tRNA (cmo5U34)-methyltransferase
MESTWKSEYVVNNFLKGKRSSIPYAADQLKIMIDLLSHVEISMDSFLDLGSGDGILSNLILDKFVDSRGYAVDFSEPMLDAARNRLQNYRGRMKFVNADISNSNWQDRVFDDNNEYVDAIVSGYCIHHLDHGRKYELYRETYDHLKQNGIFVNIEHVASKSEWGEKLSDDCFIESAYDHEMKLDKSKSRKEIEIEYHYRPDKKDNILLSPEIQCDWLRAIGFESVDIYFKYHELAVFAGIKG